MDLIYRGVGVTGMDLIYRGVGVTGMDLIYVVVTDVDLIYMGGYILLQFIFWFSSSVFAVCFDYESESDETKDDLKLLPCIIN